MRLLVLLALLVVGYWLSKMLYHHVMMNRLLSSGCSCGCVGRCKCPRGCGCGCWRKQLGDHMGDSCRECSF